VSENNKRVIVGMSGGVDSSVAAAILQEQGYEVAGATMLTWNNQQLEGKNGKYACFGPEQEQGVKDAQRVADKVGVPLYKIDLREEFQTEVIDYFATEYLAGRTPNPCVRCNKKIKFGKLIEKAMIEYKADKFATGHYVRLEEQNGRFLLKKAIDKSKDQSYFLYYLSQEQLSKCLFPLGEYAKPIIREIAKEKHLGLDGKKESQNFIAGDYTSIMNFTPVAGDIIDTNGTILGKHKGYPYYTVGQRKGLGIASSNPLYVVEIKKEKNQIIVGAKSDLYKIKLVAADLNWIAYDKPAADFRADVRIRYQHTEAPATVTLLDDGKVEVIFDEPQMAITPGQSVVFYDNDIVIGGGIIMSNNFVG